MVGRRSGVSFQPASSTIDDGMAFAQLLDVAQDGYFRAMPGKRSAEIIARAFVEANHDLSYRNVIFAELDGRIVWMGSGHTAESHRQFTNDPAQSSAT